VADRELPRSIFTPGHLPLNMPKKKKGEGRKGEKDAPGTRKTLPSLLNLELIEKKKKGRKRKKEAIRRWRMDLAKKSSLTSLRKGVSDSIRVLARVVAEKGERKKKSEKKTGRIFVLIFFPQLSGRGTCGQRKKKRRRYE